MKNLIRNLQNFERNNLKLNIEIQLLKQDFKFNKKKENDLMNEQEFEFEKNLKEKNLLHTNLIKDINEIISELIQEI